MRHRLASSIGIGNPEPEILLNNNIKLEQSEFWDDFYHDLVNACYEMKDLEGFDFQVNDDSFLVGVEPAYKYDRLCLIKFDFEDKNKSHIQTGISFGPYGSQIVSRMRLYGDYKKKSKFVKFIDKWYLLLKEKLKLGGISNDITGNS